ncbi:hypothetical protein OLMES_2626 [Oleiphilus messinensis]|uniref:Uncharacterized protein n=1 Tax=Oleiphilus messinensis TaxID=141451 RepID=A0A1Y0IA82_9GAMM|nr:hypothetical protein [Oleiphilus messinensis]ARU56676.1 hypothetical protein OLMES_2626 [Oleiphilus messinensis]
MLKLIGTTVTGLLILICHQVYADCRDFAQTAYEELYCEIKAKGKGATLPALEDFRRNTPQFQALLLKRPAAQLKLTVPPYTSIKPSLESNSLGPQSTVETPTSGATLAPPRSPQSFDKNEEGSGSVKESRPHLSACKLQRSEISCRSGKQYQLQKNKPLSQLSSSALASSNQLRLPPINGSSSEQKQKLANAYEQYIEAMLQIGLGATTMSYTRFVYTYREIKQKNADFQQRFHKMYELLKQDRRSMAVDTRLPAPYPGQLDACTRLNVKTIICDTSDKNWVYVLSSEG